MKQWSYLTQSQEETTRIGSELSGLLRGVVLLKGELGAGKTTLVRGIVAGIPGAQADEVSSPTFTLIHDYGAGVFHVDLYRLETDKEIATLGLDDVFEHADLVLVEWGERLGSRAPSPRTQIDIERRGDEERRITVSIVEGSDAAGTCPA